MFEDTASALFGVEGLRIADVQARPDSGIEVWAVTEFPAARACPECGTVSDRVHETVLARPKDVRRAGEAVDLRWVKLRRKCGNAQCPRKTFTEWVPQVPPRCRITARLREEAGHEVAARGITPAEAARHAGISWPVAHAAFAAAADPELEQAPAPTTHLGIDEHRRGRPRWRIDEHTGEHVQLADRWHTCFHDLSGRQGMLGQAEGRTAMTPRTGWPARPRPGGTRSRWSASTCAASTHRRYGACCRATLDRDAAGQEIAIAWIAKEKLRDALNLRARTTGSTPCERQVRDRLFAFYDWCTQNDTIPELASLAATISRWEGQIVAAVITGVTNATSESLNRLAKLEARLAHGFRNPANQRRRVRTACTRSTRRRSQAATRNRTHPVTEAQPNPG